MQEKIQDPLRLDHRKLSIHEFQLFNGQVIYKGKQRTLVLTQCRLCLFSLKMNLALTYWPLQHINRRSFEIFDSKCLRMITFQFKKGDKFEKINEQKREIEFFSDSILESFIEQIDIVIERYFRNPDFLDYILGCFCNQPSRDSRN